MEKIRDPMKVAKNVYKFIMENDRVRVLEASFKPGDKAIMHDHPDHVVYVLNDGKINLKSSGKTDVLDLKKGQAVFLKAQAHEAENTGKTDLHLLVVELKKQCASSTSSRCEPPHFSVSGYGSRAQNH